MEKDYNINENTVFDYNGYFNVNDGELIEGTTEVNDFVVTEYEEDEPKRDDYLFYDNDDEEIVKEERSPGMMIVVGLILAGIGIAATAISYNSGGSTFTVWYGPVFAGVISFFKGLFSLGSR